MKVLIKTIFILTAIFSLSSCHEKDYDVIDEAKKFIFNGIQESEKEKEVLKKNKEIAKSEKEKEVLKKNKEIAKNEKKIDKKNPKKTIISKKLKQIEKKEKVIIKSKKEIKSDDPKLFNSEKRQARVVTQEEDKTERNKSSYLNKPIEKVIDNESLKIGVLLPLSGENKDIGRLILNALELALFQSKESNIELIIRDTHSDPEKTKIIFNEILEEKVKIIIGPLFSKTLAAIENMVDGNVINIFALTNNQNLAKEGVWVFGVDPQKQIERVLSFASEKGYENFAALLPQNAYGLLLFETISNFTESHLINLKKIEFYEDNIGSQQNAAKSLAKGFDKYEGYLKKVKENKNEENIKIVDMPFDSVFIAASGQTLTVLASELQYNNVDPKKVQFLGTSSWEDNSILNEPALDGGIFVATSKVYQKDVSKIYNRSFNEDMPSIAMIAYDILALLNSITISEKEINVSYILNQEGYLGLRGLFRLNKNGTVERSFDIKTIKRKKFIVYEEAQSAWN